MRKLYSLIFNRKVFVLFLSTFLLLSSGNSQTTITATGTATNFWSATGGAIVFGVRNNNAGAIIITDLSTYCPASHSATYTLWYHPTVVTGVPTAINTANGWVQLPVSSPVTTTTAGVTPVFTGLSLQIPAGTIYRLALVASVNGPHYTTSGSGANIFSNGGVDILAQDNAVSPTYVGPFPGPPTTTPRGFYGSITFVPAAPCTTPPVPGTSTSSVSAPICTGTPVTLNLTGNSFGTGQTYTWQSSSALAGPYTNISSPSPSAGFVVSPSATTYYRAAVTCSGNTEYSIPVLVTVNPPFPAGTYTINSGLATGGTNYQTFADAIAALSCGIAGPVVFNVEPGSGPYNEQITIPQIGGASAVNTITFNCADVTIQATPVTANRHIVRFDGADYVTIKNLKILAMTGSGFGYGIHFMNGADRNTIENCTIDISAVTSTTQANSAGIVGSGSTTSVTADGSASFNTIRNNTIIGAYQGIIINGTATNLNAVQNQITGNIIRDFYGTGIELTDNNGTIVSGNNISRAARAAVLSPFTGVELGTGNINCTVNANRIHDTHNAATTQTGTAYGVYSNANDAAVGSENKITNNLIYNFNSTSGIQYALYNNGSDGVRYYHNTVVLDHSASTGGVARGFYQTGAATNIDIKNNLIYIGRGGTGLKYCLYFGTTTTPITSNNNILYNVSTAGTNGIGSFGTTGFTTLVDWKTANGAIYDQQSISLDPQFVSPSIGDYTPGNVLANNAGVNVGVTTDILSNPRSTVNPDAGAYEFDFIVAGLNMSAESLVGPAVSTSGCYTSAETVTVRIRNNGSTTINFATNPVTVTVNVTGAATQTLTVTLSSGTLASNATMDVALPTTLNMNAAGVYTFNASTVLTGDTNPADDAMPQAERTKAVLNAGNAHVTPDILCASQSFAPVLSTDGTQLGYSSLQWQQSTTAGTGFTNIPGASTVPYTLATPITQIMYYRLVATCGSNTQTSPEVVLTVVNPQVLSTTPGSRCGPGTVTLGATGAAGTTLKWYDAATGGVAIGTGGSFVTPSITGTTTYYVTAGTGGGNATTGLPAAITTTSTGVGTTNFGLVFDVLSPFTLQTVTVYPVSATSASGSIIIDVVDGAGTVIHSATVNVTGSPTPNVQPQTVTLNFNLQPGTNYKLRPRSFTGITSLLFEPSATAPGGNYGYPFVVPGVVSINTSTLTAPPTNTARNDLYYYFYNWVISNGCESVRTPVVATINQAPLLSVNQDTVVCNNAITALTVESNLSDYNSYIWSPSAGLFTDPAATIAYTGGSATILYAKTSTAGMNKYYINASNSVTTCANLDSVRVTVLPVTLSITATKTELCGGGTTTVSIPAGEYGNGLQWYSSVDGVVYSPVAGATSITYTSGILTDTIYYKLEIKNGAGVVCLQPTIRINVNNPQVISIAPGTRCSPGTVTLGATGSIGTTLNWYTVASDGSPIGTGNSFVTPPINTTTTYYVSAVTNGGGSASAGFANAISTTNYTLEAGLFFDALADFTLEGVHVYPTGTGAGTATIALQNSSGATLQSLVVNLTGTAAPYVKTYVPLNFTVTAGTDYRLVMLTRAGSVSGLIRESGATWGTYPLTLPGVLSITNGKCCPDATSTSYYYFYDWKVSAGCASPRTPVIANITSPEFNVQQDTVICNNAITALSVSSDIATFDSYVWSPAAGLFTDAAATVPYTGGNATTVYVKTAAEGIHKYYITANNSVTTCGSIDSVRVTVLPATRNIAATRSQLCVSGTTTLSIPAGEYGANSLQWYSSPDGTTYSLIAGATSVSYTTPVITATTYYKLEIKNGAGGVCLQPTITISVNNPQVLTTNNVTRCGPGAVTLSGTSSAGTTLNWYAASTGGTALGTGNSFTTPALGPGTTTYYVAASSGGGGIGSVGPLNPAAVGAGGGTAAAITTYHMAFDVLQPTTLLSVDIFPTATVGTNGAIEIRNSSDVVIANIPYTTTVTGGTTSQTVTLNVVLPAGTGYKMGQNPAINLFRNTAGAVYPYTSSTINIISNNFDPVYYYYFYNWQFNSGCESPRTAVTATVTPGPAFSVARDSLVCSDAITALSVESNIADFTSYSWTPMAGLYTDAAATIPYTGGSATTLYAKLSAGGVHKYYINAENNVTNCGNIDSVKLTVLPATLTLQATRTQVCGSGSTTLSLPAGEYGNAALQWYTSPDGVAYSPIAGATSASYTTPVLTATTYYKVEIKNGAGATCLQPTITISVGVPSIVSTTPATRCDPGTVTLGATTSPAGAMVNWYAAATGGLPIATGASFTTPVLSSTTTYYAAAGFGYTSFNTARLAPTPGAATNLTTYALDFTITQNITLNSVDVVTTTGTSITVALYSSGGATQLQTTGARTVPANATSTVNLGWALAPGTYRLAAIGMTGNFIRENTGITYPIPLASVGQINGFVSAITGAVTTTASYYWFYNWSISVGCESARVPVDATINGSISIDADPIDRNLCTTGETVVFSVTASGAISNYQWRKNGVNISGATSPTYTIPGVSAGDAGDYDVIVSGPCSTAFSDTATLSFDVPTIVTADPLAQQACTGGSVTFTTTATGTGSLGYQWRKDGVNIVGAYGSSFTINNISAADIGNYDVIVTGTCNQDTSLAAALTVGQATAVTTQPVTQTVCGGTNVTFTTAGTGTGTLTYQWRKGGVNINGATSASYTITGVATSDAGNYDVVITGNCGSATSSIAGLIVRPATTITIHPLAQSICIGSNVTFSVTASGAGTVTYQWRKGGVNINGATSSTYTINGVTVADIANYDVIVTGDCGAVTSNAAALTISAPGTWIGVINTDWNNPANWCGAIPTATTDVVISTTAPNMPILSNAGFARNITIQNGATVTVATGGILNLYGNITGAGVFIPTAGSIAFRGTSSQSVPAFTATNVTMNGTGGFTLAGNTTITGTLTLTNGHITLGSNNLRLANGSTGSTNSHIITNGNGAVVAAGLAASSTRIIPVGISAASYTPVIIAANAGHTTDDLSVRVRDHVLANATSGNQLTQYVVDRTWLIDELVPGGSNVNLTVQWNESDELLHFGRNESYVMQYTGGTWVPGTETFANGTNPYTQTKTNVTSFSAFAVQTDPLPIVGAGIFPNPVRTILNVVVRTNAPDRLIVSIFDPTGKLVKKQFNSVGYGGTLIGVDVTGLTAGTYILKISVHSDRELLVRKFIKMN